MTAAHALVGFIIGQVLTLEGIRLERLMTYVLSLLLIYLFTILPVFSFLYAIQHFRLESSPVMILSIAMILNEGIRCLLYFIATPYPHHAHV